tara:strand:- start:114 stop:431 length:318 start_codon:yes stop_codon:yes gene_type:complete
VSTWWSARQVIQQVATFNTNFESSAGTFNTNFKSATGTFNTNFESSAGTFNESVKSIAFSVNLLAVVILVSCLMHNIDLMQGRLSSSVKYVNDQFRWVYTMWGRT